MSDPKPIAFEGKINLIINDQQLEAVANELMQANEFGFDTETRPSFKVGQTFKVALLQLATQNTAYVIRLHGLRHFETLRTIFENKDVLKVGVAIHDDIKNLQKLFKFTPKNFTELQHLAKAKGLKNFGLKGMTEEVLNAKLSKAAKLTNWEAPTLTAPQILYAATDAWIGLELYKKLTLKAPLS